MDTIWTGVVAGSVAALVTIAVQLLTQRHQRNLLSRELEHQTRTALRQTYEKLLGTQRRSRETSLRLATRAAGVDTSAGDESLSGAATDAHVAFIEHYHQLNLDASREMWIEARGLRHVLDDMLEAAQEGDADRANELYELARAARQNLERSFRARLGHEVLQKRKPLSAPYDKASTWRQTGVERRDSEGR
jgi:hypothetical protein